MGLRARNKQLHEVNMSSMTDIIFFLLVFFMLTSTLVKFHEMDLPKSDSRAPAPSRINVDITKDGKISVDGVPVTTANMEAYIAKAIKAKTEPGVTPTVTIAGEIGLGFGKISPIIAIANKYKAKAIIATEPRQ